MKMLIFSLRILHSIFFVICSFKGFCLLQKENSASEIFFSIQNKELYKNQIIVNQRKIYLQTPLPMYVSQCSFFTLVHKTVWMLNWKF